jgi:hypothetical protein
VAASDVCVLDRFAHHHLVVLVREPLFVVDLVERRGHRRRDFVFHLGVWAYSSASV